MDKVCKTCSIAISSKSRSGFCIPCYGKNYQALNRDHYRELEGKYREENRDLIKARDSQRRKDNPEKYNYAKKHGNKWAKAWREKNPAKVEQYYKNKKKYPYDAEYFRNYTKTRYSQDPNYRLAVLIRSRLGSALRKQRIKHKPCSTTEALGCTFNELMRYLELKFYSHPITNNEMTWKNQGIEWDLDHIKPLCSFDLTNQDQFNKATHHTNLQPLWKEEHMIKTVNDIRKSIQGEI